MSLPFLVVHGAVVWKVGLVALEAGLLGGIALVRRARTKRRVDEQLAVRLGGMVPLRDGSLVLGAILRGGSITTVTRGGVTIDHVEGEPVLETEDGVRVEPTAPPRVVLGARAQARGWWIPRGVPASVRARLPKLGRVRVDRVAAGDLVNARGVGAKVLGAAAGADGYRDEAARWTLSPDLAFEAQLSVAAMHPAIRPPARPLTILAIVAALGFGAVKLLDHEALVTNNLSLRLMSKNLRSIGLSQFVDHYEQSGRGGHGDRARDDDFDELDELSPPTIDSIPCVRTQRRIGSNRFDDALAEAPACGPGITAQLLAIDGRYADAFALTGVDAETRGGLAIATGHWDVAAAAAEEIATRVDHETRPERPELAARLHCFATWVRTRDDALVGDCPDNGRIDLSWRTTHDSGGVDYPRSELAEHGLYFDQRRLAATSARDDAWTRANDAVIAYVRGDTAKALALVEHLRELDDGLATALADELHVHAGDAGPPPPPPRLYIDGGDLLAIEYAVDMRDEAHRAHAAAAEHRWQTTIDRHLAMWSDPDRASARYLWDMLSGP